MSTIRQILTREKPEKPQVYFRRGKADRRIRHRAMAKNMEICKWNKFTLENLEKAYGPLLDFPDDETASQPYTVPAESSSDPETLIKSSIIENANVMKPTLKFGQARRGIREGAMIKQTYAPIAGNFVPELMGVTNQSFTADHIIYFDESPEECLVVGIGQPGWSGRHALRGRAGTRLKHPLVQLFRRCKMAGTRYGYIQGETDLTVCCFSKDGAKVKAKMMAAPLSWSGDKRLTSHLALWWLCMQAMSAESRVIVERQAATDIEEQNASMNEMQSNEWPCQFMQPMSAEQSLDVVGQQATTDFEERNASSSEMPNDEWSCQFMPTMSAEKSLDIEGQQATTDFEEQNASSSEMPNDEWSCQFMPTMSAEQSLDIEGQQATTDFEEQNASSSEMPNDEWSCQFMPTMSDEQSLDIEGQQATTDFEEQNASSNEMPNNDPDLTLPADGFDVTDLFSITTTPSSEE